MALIQLSSTGGEAPCPLLAHYTATKVFNMVFAQLIAKNLNSGVKANGIMSTTVHPGAVTTGMTKNFSRQGMTSFPEQTSLGTLQNLDLNLTSMTSGSFLHAFTRL